MSHTRFGRTVCAALCFLPLAETARGDGAAGQPDLRARVLQRFDKDGDGQLNEQERQTVRQAMQDRVAGQGAGTAPAVPKRSGSASGAAQKSASGRLPANAKGPGAGSRDINPELRARMLKQFDRDGDGQLNETERQAAFRAMQQLRARAAQTGKAPPAAVRRPN